METEMFKPGDRVVLNSGGPTMTVVSTHEDGSLVYCTWMSDCDVYEDDFIPAIIKHADTLTLDP